MKAGLFSFNHFSHFCEKIATGRSLLPHWACLVQNEIDGGIDIVVDGQFRYPFDLEEMMALIMLTPDALSFQHEKMIRRWVKAKLEHYYAKAASTQSSEKSKNSTQK